MKQQENKKIAEYSFEGILGSTPSKETKDKIINYKKERTQEVIIQLQKAQLDNSLSTPQRLVTSQIRMSGAEKNNY